MKADLFTAILSAFFGVIIAYLITANLLISAPSAVSIKTLSGTIDTSLDEPSSEVFNYRALNPTVEVYIDCANYAADGSCASTRGDNLESQSSENSESAEEPSAESQEEPQAESQEESFEPAAEAQSESSANPEENQ